MRTIYVLISLFFLASCNDSHSEQRPSVYLLMGQSNMSGHGRPDQLSSPLPVYADKVRIFGNDWQWHEGYVPEDDGLGQVDQVSYDAWSGVGPGLPFADEMIRSGAYSDIMLVPCATSGSAIDEWLPPLIRDDRSTLYGSCLSRAREAAWSGDVAGALFYQGESDTYSIELAEAWPIKFRQTVTAIREDLGKPALPIVFVQIGPISADMRATKPHGFIGWEPLQDEQARISIPGVAMVPAWDLPTNPDGVHLSTAAQLELGKRMAHAMAEIKKEAQD